jgi:hypothetical protein
MSHKNKKYGRTNIEKTQRAQAAQHDQESAGLEESGTEGSSRLSGVVQGLKRRSPLLAGLGAAGAATYWLLRTERGQGVCNQMDRAFNRVKDGTIDQVNSLLQRVRGQNEEADEAEQRRRAV